MREAHPRERAVGIEYYASDADGTGGRLRETPEDFRVREIEAIDPEPLSADPEVYNHLLVRATLRGWDTNDFAGEVSDRLGISRERVSWAGTKDAHAHTTQLFSIDGVNPADVPEVRDAEIEPVGRFGRRLYLGDLAGNAFEIRVADPEMPENATAVTGELREFGGFRGSDDRLGRTDGDRVAVPNYFGQQRFGSRRPVTHEVGLAIVRGDWKEAVLRYVGNPSDAEPEDSQEARAYTERTEDWSGALERMPDRLGYERAMLHALVERGGESTDDFRAAVDDHHSIVEVTRPRPPTQRAASTAVAAVRETAETKTSGQLSEHGGGAVLFVDCSSFHDDQWQAVRGEQPEVRHRPAVVYRVRPDGRAEGYSKGAVPLDLDGAIEWV